MVKRKRTRQEAAAAKEDLFRLTGLVSNADNPADGSLEDCLKELEGRASSSVGMPANQEEGEAQKAPNSARTESNRSNSCSLLLSSTYHPTIAERNMVTNWNRSFQNWTHQGTYTAGLLPSFDVELARHFQIKELSSFLLKSCSSLKMPSFERWLIDTKLEEKLIRASRQLNTADESPSSSSFSASDPILSGTVTMDFESSQRLVAEIIDSGVEKNEAEKTVRELCRRTTQTAAPDLQSQTRRYANQIPLKKGDRIAFEDNGNSVSLVYHRKRWKKPFCVKLNRKHYEKLQTMFLQVHNITASDYEIKFSRHRKQTKAVHAFHLIVMALILRYSSLSGGQLLNDLRGGGMQGAIHRDVFDVLSDSFPGCNMLECFASPFNAYLPSFYSAFYDIDWHFGSKGNFLNSENVIQGCVEANPPFSPGFMNAMVERFEKSLLASNKQSKPLTIIAVVPTASAIDMNTPAAKRFAYSSFQSMVSSPRCRFHIVLPAREHGYIEGAQHVRPTQYKDSNYDTSVIVLQNSLAQQQQLDGNDFEQKIRAAFVSRHNEELQRRQQDIPVDR